MALGNDVDLAVFLVEGNLAVAEGEEGVVAAHTYILTSVETSAALTDDDVAGYDCFATKLLNAEALAVAIATVLGSTLSFFYVPWVVTPCL